MNRKALERDSLYLLGAYTLLFAWVVARTIYQDHTDLVFRATKLNDSFVTQKTADAKMLQSTKDSLNASLTDLKVQCGIKEGMNLTLQKQNRDQQNTINHCQEDAINLLTPQAQKTTVVFFGRDDSKSSPQARFLLLTNTAVTPVRMNVICNWSMQSVSVTPVNAGVMGGTSRLNSTTWETNIDSPTWSPTLPLLATINYEHGGDLNCSFLLK